MRFLVIAALALVSARFALADTFYVSLSGGHTPPFTNWPTAATNIQAAIDQAVAGDTVLVTNGVYDTGGVVVHGGMTNRIAITEAVTVRSVNDPDHTHIVGNGPMGDTAVRCAYVGRNARLAGFTLTNGHTRLDGDEYREQSGGGVWSEPSGVTSNCIIAGNKAGTADPDGWGGNGGGVFGGHLYKCTVSGNSAVNGGGTAWSVLRNCLVTGNRGEDGGGMHEGWAQNCTVVSNSADRGGGTYSTSVESSIVYFNDAPTDPNCSGGTIQHTCTAPDHLGVGNISDDPLLWELATGNLHLSAASPCRDVGSDQPWMTGASDFDGNPRVDNGAVDMGAYEFVSAGNGDHFVSSRGINRWPYWNWHTAATDIPTAMGAASTDDTVWVTNGVYDTGQTIIHAVLATRVAITKAITLRSIAGPENTFIVGKGPLGDNAVRCAYVGDGAQLVGFTLTNGHTRLHTPKSDKVGGGVWCESTAVVSDCFITGNTAWGGGGTYSGIMRRCTIFRNTAVEEGGGASHSTLQSCTISGNIAWSGGGVRDSTVDNCLIVGNEAGGSGGGVNSGTARGCVIAGNKAFEGGGADGGILQNCTIVGNEAVGHGGGTDRGTVQNSIVYYNTCLTEDTANFDSGLLSYTCTTPRPSGEGNITDPPMFMNANAWGNLRLSQASPCIDAGTDLAWIPDARDLDGLPRIIHGTVDMGAYEWPHMMISSIAPPPTSSEGPVITWGSFTGAQYAVHGSTNLVQGYDLLLQENIDAQPPLNAFTDTVSGVELRGYAVEYRP